MPAEQPIYVGSEFVWLRKFHWRFCRLAMLMAGVFTHEFFDEQTVISTNFSEVMYYVTRFQLPAVSLNYS